MRRFSMYALTKAYAMGGWRLGYVACPGRFMPALTQITVNDVAHGNVFIQHDAREAISGKCQYFDKMLAEDNRRHRLVCERLDAIKGIRCPLPEGTIHAFPDVRAFNKPSAQIANELMVVAGVVTESGTFYGPAGEGHLCVCFSSEPYDVLEEERPEPDLRSLSWAGLIFLTAFCLAWIGWRDERRDRRLRGFCRYHFRVGPEGSHVGAALAAIEFESGLKTLLQKPHFFG